MFEDNTLLIATTDSNPINDKHLYDQPSFGTFYYYLHLENLF